MLVDSHDSFETAKALLQNLKWVVEMGFSILFWLWRSVCSEIFETGDSFIELAI